MSPEAALKALPALPGVYLFRGERGQVLYVGKAANLRQRVRSYFQGGGRLEGKTQALVGHVRDVEWITTGSELEAFLLEENLIKEHRPKYNILLRDDKHYPFLKVTGERFPKVGLARRREDDGAAYFGPYPSGQAVREAIRLLQQLFRLRTCGEHKFATVRRPCLLYHIDRCSAPCVGRIDEATYRTAAEEAVAFLSGRREEVRRRIAREMEQAADELRFEEAARLRDRLRAIDQVLAQQTVVLPKLVDLDAVGAAREGTEAVADVFQVRRGQVVGRQRYVFQVGADDPLGEIVRRTLAHHFRAYPVPDEVLVPVEVADRETVAAFLAQARGRAVRLGVPRRGAKERLVALAVENARQGLLERRGEEGWRREGLVALREALGLPEIPRRIEGYDVANTQGTLAQAAMVVFLDGAPEHAHYRRFNIRGVSGPDDFASLAEAVRRRFAHLRDDDPSFGTPPDLILVDGGAGQLGAVAAALGELGLEPVPELVALAKRFEELYRPGIPDPLRLPARHPGLRLLMQVRDEAHRFSNQGHARRRERAMVRSRLDDVEGIGPRRRRLLLAAFGSVAGIRRASVEEIVAAGIPRPVAERLKVELEG